MKTHHIQNDTTISPTGPALPKRRAILAALGCVGLGMANAWSAAGETQRSFALTSPQRAANLRERVKPDVAAALVAQAVQTLERMPNLMPVVHTAGLLPGEGNREASLRAQEDWRQTRLQALAYRLSGNAAHADCAARYIEAWMSGYAASFHPVDETELASLLLGFDLVQDRLSPALVARVEAFAKELARGYLATPIRVGDASTGLNNWHSHRMKLGTAGAFISGDAALIAETKAEFLRHVERNVRADGGTYDFEQRDAMHYVVYTLDPILVATSIAAAHGQDWYAAPVLGGRLQRALEWLKPYALGERTHEEFVNSKVEFDRKRAQAGVKGYAGSWGRNEAVTVFWLAARLDPQFGAVSAALVQPPEWAQALYSQRFYN